MAQQSGSGSIGTGRNEIAATPAIWRLNTSQSKHGRAEIYKADKAIGNSRFPKG
jgi:hypothetical protein